MFFWAKNLNIFFFYKMRFGYLLIRLFFYKIFLSYPLTSRRLTRYRLAILSIGITLFVCLLLNQALDGRRPLTLFIIPVVVSAWLGGLGPGLLATLLSGLASECFLTKPHFSLFSMNTVDWERLTLFLATSGL